MRSTKFVFVFEKIAFSYLCLNKQTKLKVVGMKIYIFPQCIYRSYIFRSFIEQESNVSPQPKRRKVTGKKTPLAKSMNKKTMFTKILSRQEANEEIEIDSD